MFQDEKPKRKLKAKLVPEEAFVSTEIKKTGETVPELKDKTEVLGVKEFAEEPAMVGIEHGVTLNLGNYESARISVSLRLPCANKPEEHTKAYEYAKKWIEDRVQAEVQEIKNYVKGSLRGASY